MLAEIVEKVEEAIRKNHLSARHDLQVIELKLIEEIEQVRMEI